MNTGENRQKVKNGVHNAYEMLAKTYGIALEKGDYPIVMIRNKGETAFYPDKFSIVIDSKDIDDGISYFEEASHALRHVSLKRQGIDHGEYDYSVQEFYGRAGETLGRYLTKETDLEYLFENKNPRDLTDPKTRKMWADRLREIHRMKLNIFNAGKMMDSNQELIRTITHSNYESLERVFADFIRGNVSTSEFEDRVVHLEKSYRGNVSELGKKSEFKLCKIDMLDLENYLNMYGFIKDIIREKEIGSESEKRRLYLREIDYFRDFIFSRIDKLFEADDPRLFNIAIDVRSHIVSHQTHSKPYLYAQQFSAEDFLGMKNFYALPDEEIKRRFFNRKSKTTNQNAC